MQSSALVVDESILLLVTGNRFDGQWCKILLVVAMVSSLQIEAAADEDIFDESIFVYLYYNIYSIYKQLLILYSMFLHSPIQPLLLSETEVLPKYLGKKDTVSLE